MGGEAAQILELTSMKYRIQVVALQYIFAKLGTKNTT